MKKIVIVGADKGGCGKTTTAVWLMEHMIADLDVPPRKIIAVDFDPQCDLSKRIHFDIRYVSHPIVAEAVRHADTTAVELAQSICDEITDHDYVFVNTPGAIHVIGSNIYKPMIDYINCIDGVSVGVLYITELQNDIDLEGDSITYWVGKAAKDIRNKKKRYALLALYPTRFGGKNIFEPSGKCNDTHVTGCPGETLPTGVWRMGK